ncbi:TonB-dependent receptor [Novosphingobium bradum]|uniref:TonB-dependent receptor n=1 Tax=Novosphingobium bradum TaxID=1737444 RepID=A0ABV7IKI3_9SPHN
MKRIVVTALAAACLPNAALAAEAEAGADAGDAGIVVIGQRDGYRAEQSASATRTDTPLLDLPQSIAVVTRERMDDQAQRSMGEVLRYVPGTTVGQGEGNRDQIVLRGQATTADFFLDGLRDDVQYYRSLYNIERVEVLKGASALVFGRGGSGGVINRVQKAPAFDRLAITAATSVNTFGGWDVATDVNAPISGKAALRLNATYESLANARDYFGGKRYAANPSLALDLGAWKLGLSYEYVHDDRVVDRGVPSIATSAGQPNQPLTGYQALFFGVPGINRTGLDAHIARARLDGALADNLTWSTTVAYGDYDKYYTNVFANGAATSQTGTVALSSYKEAVQRQNVIAQSNLVWDLATGPLAHKLLLGVEFANQDTASQRRDGTLSSSTLNLAAIVRPTVSFGALARDVVSTVKTWSAYAQDQVGIGDHVDLVLGLRYDRFAIRGTDRAGTPRPFARTDEMVTPRLGLILKPRADMAFYASYSRSFLPRSGDQFVQLTAAQANLAPERFTNREIGFKWDVTRDLALTVALFRLDRTNATTPDPANPTVTINIGETRTRGLELGLSGRLARRWQVSGGYTWQDGTLRGNGAVKLAQVPHHQFALWNRYDVSPAFGLGLGVVHQSSAFAAIRTVATTTRLPAFTRVDGGVFWTVTPRLNLQLNIENLLDATYFSDAHNANNITPGAPRNARLSARVKF